MFKHNIFYNKYHVITTAWKLCTVRALNQPQSQLTDVAANTLQFQNSCCKLAKSTQLVSVSIRSLHPQDKLLKHTGVLILCTCWHYTQVHEVHHKWQGNNTVAASTLLFCLRNRGQVTCGIKVFLCQVAGLINWKYNHYFFITKIFGKNIRKE